MMNSLVSILMAVKTERFFFTKETDGIFRKSFHKEEHVSLIGEPGAQYLNHVSLKRGRALDILHFKGCR